MARITGNAGSFDTFKTKCHHCGREITYGRRDIRQHVRWPKGFIYCPACRVPVGHDESNLLKSGEEILREKEELRLKQLAAKEMKKAGLPMSDELKQALPSPKFKVMRILKIIFLATGIPTLVVGALGMLITMAIQESYLLLIFAFVVFPIGLGTTIAGGVLARKLR